MNERKTWPLAWEALQALTAHYGPAINGEAELAGIPNGQWYGWLLAAHLFDPEPVSAQRLSVRSAYTSPAWLEWHLAQGARLGLLTGEPGGDYRLTAAGRSAVDRMIAAAYAAMAPLRPLPDADLHRLADLLGRLVQASLAHPAPPDPWSLRIERRYDPGADAPPLVRLDQHLSDLGAYRDDSHLGAWRPHGVSGPAWEAFTLIWRGEAASADELAQHLAHRGYDSAAYAAALRELEDRGWAAGSASGWQLTPAGQAVRIEAEELTDRYFYAPWAVLTGAEHAELRDLLVGLRAGLDQLRLSSNGQPDVAAGEPLPRWQLSNVYPALDSAEYAAAAAKLAAMIEDLEALFMSRAAAADAFAPVPELAALVGDVIDRLNQALELAGTLEPYVAAFVTVDSRDPVARRKYSELEIVRVRLDTLLTRVQALAGRLAPVLQRVIDADERVGRHAFLLREAAEQSKYLMSDPEEALAAELSLDGLNAWSKLQGTLTSQLTETVDVNGRLLTLPLPAVINLHSHPDESVRRRAYEAELHACASVRESLAACMNGVKGTQNTLSRRRGRAEVLDEAIDLARIDRATLDAMMGAITASFPTFRKYFRAKARRLGKEKLAWWDIFAPTGAAPARYGFAQARDFILANFATFSDDLAGLAQRAFDQHWIDAEPRDGKRGGAFCMSVYGVRESRILCNFDGTLDQVSTVAHELGHAYHNHCLYQAGKAPLQSTTPMTMAETASIMCETIVMQAVLSQTTDPGQELAILETMLTGDAQVIVDIASRFLFEQEVLQRRRAAELSADDFCEIMERAQSATYGDGVDERYLHKYMWAWKPHYYRPDLSFYNFPYAFGLLFGLGLYAIYRQRGPAFIPDYVALLASTGEGTAADLAARFGIDLRGSRFWQDSLGMIGERIDRYCAL